MQTRFAQGAMEAGGATSEGRSIDRFLATVVGLLLVTAGLKGWGVFEALGPRGAVVAGGWLALPAPWVEGLTNGQILFVAVLFEVGVASLVLLLPQRCHRLTVVAWVGGLFASYHVGLWLSPTQPPCGCLGMPGAGSLTPGWTEEAMAAVLIAYFLVGSYLGLARLGRQRFSCRPSSAPRHHHCSDVPGSGQH